ncbi:hypothetical protein B0I37DRAFT_365100 [Chaetomium sp. MPI-CAGE-AT-0009]|nr:hypothetical protein B0I37DRAFT_365100 [Chaetomium sp. MPI-CAGE-AT-0009]
MADIASTASTSWNPPLDSEKPHCPYTAHFSVDITRHLPPPPFGNEYGSGDWPTDATWEWLRSVTPTKHVLRYPPLESRTPLPGPQRARLTITKPIAVEDGRGPQLVLCSIAPNGAGPNNKSFTAVAKIFDPLYYSFRNKLASHEPVDVAFEADGDYSREAAAYEHLQKMRQTGSFAPSYYGSWTFNLSIRHDGVVRHRAIRLILIENLHGACMRDLCNDPRAMTYDEGYRLGVLAKILDGYVRQEHQGCLQDDLAPRNIILVPGPQHKTGPQPIPRVVLIDYNNAIVYDRTIAGRDASDITKLPKSPLDWFWDDTLPQFDGWRPPQWNANYRVVQKWLLKEFHGKNASLYEPPQGELTLDPPREAPVNWST